MEKNKDILLWIIIGVIILLFIFGGFGTGGYGMMGSGGMMGFGFLFMLLFWGAIIWIVVAFINGFSASKDESTEDFLDILKKRYAAGKISKKQYEKMKKELE